MACYGLAFGLLWGRGGGDAWRGEYPYSDLLCQSRREQIGLASTLGGASYPWRVGVAGTDALGGKHYA